ncbi:hypothetical protein AAGW05_14540 [Arthrobacter sp. LAPM80]
MRKRIAGWNDNPEGFAFPWRTGWECLDRLDEGIATAAACPDSAGRPPG